MKTNVKRFISVLLAAVMLCGLLAIVPVSAEEPAPKTLTVMTTSNFFEPSETTFTVNGETFVYVDFKMYAQDKLLVNADIRGLTYDSDVLEWKEEYNQIRSGRDAKINFFAAADELGIDSVVRKTREGRIIGNFSSVSTPIPAFGKNNEPITVVTAVFKVLKPDAGSTTVDCQVNYMALCDAEKSGSPEVQYQAVSNYNKNTSLDFITTDSDVAGEQNLFAGQTISLYGDIAVNFYLNLTAEQIAQGVEVYFTWNNKAPDPVTPSLNNNRYCATCNVAPAEMADIITVKVKIGKEMMRQTKQYSVCEYTDVILNESYKTDHDLPDDLYQALSLLIKAMLDYGTKAQAAFRTDVVPPPPANGGTDYLNYDDVTTGIVPYRQKEVNSDMLEAEYGLKYYNSTIIYLTEITMRHYFTVTDWDKFNAVKDAVTFDGEPVNYINKGTNLICFDLKGINASQLGEMKTLSVNGDYKLNSSVYDYVYRCLESTRVTDKTKALVKATYRYGEAANEYFRLMEELYG